MKIVLKEDKNTKEQYFELPRSFLDSIFISYKDEIIQEISEKYNSVLIEIISEISELVQENEKIKTDLRGFDMKGLTENIERINELISVLKLGINIKIEK